VGVQDGEATDAWKRGSDSGAERVRRRVGRGGGEGLEGGEKRERGMFVLRSQL